MTTNRIRVRIETNPAMPVPHITNITGVSDEAGRFKIWDAITECIAYGLDGLPTIDWQNLNLPKSTRRRLIVCQGV